MPEFSFDFSFIRAGSPVVTLSSTGISFNAGARNLLGYPEQVDIGYDVQAKAIGVCAHKDDNGAKPYEFESRAKDGWIRINAKEFSRYLEQQTSIKFREKARQFIPDYNEATQMLIVVIDEEHAK